MAETEGEEGRVRDRPADAPAVEAVLWAHSNVVAVEDATEAGDRLAARATAGDRDLLALPDRGSLERACRVGDYRRS